MKYFYSTLKYLALITLAIILLKYAFKGIDLHRIMEGIKQANYFWVFLSVFVSVISHLSRSYRWKLLYETVGFKPSIFHTFYAVMSGYLANLAFPRMGEVTRCAVLKKTDNIPLDISIGTVVTERAFDTICMLGLFLTVFMVEIKDKGGKAMEEFNIYFNSKISSLANSYPLLIIAGIILLFLLFLLIKFRNKLGSIKIIRKIFTFFEGIFKGILSIFKLKRKWEFLFHTLLIWTCYFFMTYIVFKAIPATAELGWMAGLAILVIGSIGMTIPAPGGIGSFHFFTAYGLVMYGLTYEDGILYATLIHGIMMLLIILIGSVCLGLVFLENKKKDLLKTGSVK